MRVQLSQFQQDMFLKYIKKIFNKKETDKKNFSNKFKELGKKKGSRSDFVKLYKEMKKFKDEK